MAETTLTFLGTAAVLPGPGQDTSHFVINGRVLVDTGWSAALRLRQFGYDPLAIEHLVFTHCHHDHYMGLAGLLFYRGMSKRQGVGSAPPLRIVGTADDAPRVLELTRAFLQTQRFHAEYGEAELTTIAAGDRFETDAFCLETAPNRHSLPGVMGRFTDKQSSVVIAFTGDTGPTPDLAPLARGADLLIHEASLPPESPDEKATEHCRATDAARVAAEAGVKRLRLVHLSGDHGERSLAAARAIFPETELAGEGETLVLRR